MAATMACASRGRQPGPLVVKNDLTLSEEDVARFRRETLTGYKLPKYIEFRDELLKTNVGKILRRELRTAKH